MVTEQDAARRAASGGRDALRLLLGIVDAGLEQAENAVHAARGLLGRADLGELASEVRSDLNARGDAVLGRIAPSGESHMETVARRAREARQETAGSASGDGSGAGDD